MDKMKIYENALHYHATGSLKENVAHSIYGTAKRTGKKEFIARSDGVSKDHALQNHHKKSPHTSNLYSDVHAVREGVEDDVKNAPFAGAKPAKDEYKDKFGNTVKQKNIAKHLAKKGMNEEEVSDALRLMDELEEHLAELEEFQEAFEEMGIEESDFDDDFTKKHEAALHNEEFTEEELDAIAEAALELYNSETVEEGFQNMSKTKRLIARRKAGRSKKLTSGYTQMNNRKAVKKMSQLKKMR